MALPKWCRLLLQSTAATIIVFSASSFAAVPASRQEYLPLYAKLQYACPHMPLQGRLEEPHMGPLKAHVGVWSTAVYECERPGAEPKFYRTIRNPAYDLGYLYQAHRNFYKTVTSPDYVFNPQDFKDRSETKTLFSLHELIDDKEEFIIPKADGGWKGYKFSAREPGDQGDSYSVLNAYEYAKAPSNNPKRDFDWALSSTSGDMAAQIYRVHTKGGKPTKACGNEDRIEEPFHAQYWIWTQRCEPGIGHSSAVQPFCRSEGACLKNPAKYSFSTLPEGRLSMEPQPGNRFMGWARRPVDEWQKLAEPKPVPYQPRRGGRPGVTNPQW